jgi:hypothetical protein
MLSSILTTPYPPPDLLHPMAEKIQIIPANAAPETPEVTAIPPEPEMVQAPPASTKKAK